MMKSWSVVSQQRLTEDHGQCIHILSYKNPSAWMLLILAETMAHLASIDLISSYHGYYT